MEKEKELLRRRSYLVAREHLRGRFETENDLVQRLFGDGQLYDASERLQTSIRITEEE